MVFHTYICALRPRSMAKTTQVLRELALFVYAHDGALRSLTNEGIIRTYRHFRDAAGDKHTYVRFVRLQVDLDEEQSKEFVKMMRDHPDIVRAQWDLTEKSRIAGKAGNNFPLDTFTRLEEELAWPPQVNTDVYDQLDMNWKEFSRTRWSNYLRS